MKYIKRKNFNLGIFTMVCFWIMLPSVLANEKKEAYPQAPRSGGFSESIKEQSGVGSANAYGKAGVLEVGGSLGFISASKFTQFNVAPTMGWFFSDNLEISGIFSFNYASLGSNSTVYWSALAEPSYHYPFTNTIFGFLGVGAGFSYINNMGVGLALVPRVGANFLIGRSGVLSPALFVSYNSLGTVPLGDGSSALALDTLYGMSVSLTTLW